VFLGFVGKLQAEVRLTCTDRVCGLSSRHSVAKGYTDAPVQVCEERVFNAGIASLFLAIEDHSRQLAIKEPSPLILNREESGNAANIPMFELQRGEAHDLVRSVLQRAHKKDGGDVHMGSLSNNSPGMGAANVPAAASGRPSGDVPAACTVRAADTLLKPGGDHGLIADDEPQRHQPPSVQPQRPLQDRDLTPSYVKLQMHHQELQQQLHQQLQQIASSPRVLSPRGGFAATKG